MRLLVCIDERTLCRIIVLLYTHDTIVLSLGHCRLVQIDLFSCPKSFRALGFRLILPARA